MGHPYSAHMYTLSVQMRNIRPLLCAYVHFKCANAHYKARSGHCNVLLTLMRGEGGSNQLGWEFFFVQSGRFSVVQKFKYFEFSVKHLNLVPYI